MSRVTDHLTLAADCTDLAVRMIAANEPEERIMSAQVRALEMFARWHHKEAQRSARWLYGDHRWPIAPERESEWFANRYGLGHYEVSESDRRDHDPDWQSWGKFDSQFCEIVWEWSLESDSGNLIDSEDEYACALTLGTLDLLAVFPILCEEFPRGDVPSAAIVWTDSRGFVSVDFFDSVAEMEAECDAIRARQFEAQNEACESGNCQPCDHDPKCEDEYACEHSAHDWCQRSEWLPSIDERSKGSGSLAEELRDAERWANAFEGSEMGE